MDEPTNLPAKWNLPQALLGPAGAAISKLIGKAVDIPSAKLDAVAQRIKDEISAESTVTKAIAHAVAKQAVKDPAIMQRGLEKFVSKQFRKQENLEAVAHKTAEILSDAPVDSLEKAAEPDSDWMNIFERHAEDASTERMRDMWARVIAGEIRKPKSVSLRTLNFVAQLDQEIAQLFEKYAPHVIEGNVLPVRPRTKGVELIELVRLEEYGLLAEKGLSQTYAVEADSRGYAFHFQNGAIVCVRADNTEGKAIEFQISCALLSRVGVEILAIVNPPFTRQAAEAVANLIPKSPEIGQISVFNKETHTIGEVLWKRESPKES